MQRDIAALSPASVSYPIETAWSEAVQLRGGSGWTCAMWPAGQMMIVAPPYGTDTEPVAFVANSRTGAWARFKPWKIKSICGFSNRIFIGSENGQVLEANVGGTDSGSTYTASYVPLYVDAGSPASLKIAGLARHTLRSRAAPSPYVGCQFDWDSTLPAPPDAPLLASIPVWDSAIWDGSVWGATIETTTTADWYSVGGRGYVLAPSLQITSGSTVPLDVEVIRTDLMYQVAEVVT